MKMLRHSNYVIAVDIGGTKIRVALISHEGKIVYSKKQLSNAIEGPEHVINKLEYLIDKVISSSGIKTTEVNAISLAVAGIIDVNKGVVVVSPHLFDWHMVEIRRIITDRFHLPVFMINDASAAAIGEHRLGAGKGYSNVIYITVSTGIGGGIIVNNKIYYGQDGTAGEFGHMIIMVDGPKCHCGQHGCLESLASGTALRRMVIEEINAGKLTILSRQYGNINDIDAEKIATAAKKGDKLSQDSIAKASYYLGIGMSNIINIFNPEIIIIGGGLSMIGNAFLTPAKITARKTAFKLPASSVKIMKSKLGDNAGIIGAAISAFDQI